MTASHTNRKAPPTAATADAVAFRRRAAAQLVALHRGGRSAQDAVGDAAGQGAVSPSATTPKLHPAGQPATQPVPQPAPIPVPLAAIPQGASANSNDIPHLLPHRSYGWGGSLSGKVDDSKGLGSWWHRTRPYRLVLLLVLLISAAWTSYGFQWIGGACSTLGNSATLGRLCHGGFGQQAAFRKTLDYLIGQHQQLVSGGQRSTRLTLITDPQNPGYSQPTNMAVPLNGQNAPDLTDWGYKVDVLLPSGQGRLPSLVLYRSIDDPLLCQRLNSAAGLPAAPTKLPTAITAWQDGSQQPIDWSKAAHPNGKPLANQGCVELADSKLLFFHALPIR